MWLLGGLFLYLIAARLTTRFGRVVALALYLFWPYAAFISRLYMPDASMLAVMLGATLAVLRYWEAPSFARLGAAGAASAFATLVKPGVALLFLAPLFVALATANGALRDVLARGRLAFFVSLALLPSVVYYVYGTYVRDFLLGESEGRVEPSLIATAWFCGAGGRWSRSYSRSRNAKSFSLSCRLRQPSPAASLPAGRRGRYWWGSGSGTSPWR
jgi:4-amino-4-deoxy-L-arabinose transferase-like glycosyltransferase